jgi:Polyketide cyclase / dehydrase and lipid transport
MPQVIQYHLASRWNFTAPVGAVWAELSRPELWPVWWKGVQAVDVLERGDGAGLGAYRRLTWSGLALTRISFNLRTVKIEPRALIESVADGDLAGIGRWQLLRAGAGTEVQHDWIVNVNVPAVPVLGALFGLLFKWNYHWLMEAGRRGLESRVGVRLR